MKLLMDNFKECITTKYATFEGRANCSEYWYFVLVNFLLDLFFGIAKGILASFVLFGYNSRFVMLLSTLFIGFLALLSLVLFIPGLAVTVRRLHDVGKSGWMLLVLLIPLIGVIWLLVLLVRKGEPQDNRYGAPPISQ